MDFKLKRVKGLINRLDVDALIITEPANIFYLTDLPITVSAINPVLNSLQKFNPSILLVTADGERILFCSASLAQYCEENVKDIQVLFYPSNLFIDHWGAKKADIFAGSLDSCINKFFFDNKHLEKIGVDNNSFSTTVHKELYLKIENVVAELGSLRSVKSTEEIERIHYAARAAYNAMGKVKEIIDSNEVVVEKDLFFTVQQELLNRECQWNYTTVASGKYSADIFHEPLMYTLKPGDAVRLDLGAVYKGYGSDIARTFFVKEPPEEISHLYAVVSEAKQEVLAALRPGVETGELFKIGQEYVQNNGFPQYQRRMIGHGVGIETEEEPFLSPNSQDIVEEGMVLSIEIPYYIKGTAGLNTEDIVIITKGGYSILN